LAQVIREFNNQILLAGNRKMLPEFPN